MGLLPCLPAALLTGLVCVIVVLLPTGFWNKQIKKYWLRLRVKRYICKCTKKGTCFKTDDEGISTFEKSIKGRRSLRRKKILIKCSLEAPAASIFNPYLYVSEALAIWIWQNRNACLDLNKILTLPSVLFLHPNIFIKIGEIIISTSKRCLRNKCSYPNLLTLDFLIILLLLQ